MVKPNWWEFNQAIERLDGLLPSENNSMNEIDELKEQEKFWFNRAMNAEKAGREYKEKNKTLRSKNQKMRMDLKWSQVRIAELEQKVDDTATNYLKVVAGRDKRIEQLKATLAESVSLVADQHTKIEQYDKAIDDFLEGNYPHPRSYRPDQCPHKRYYYEDCGDCDEEYWSKTLNRIRGNDE